MESNAVRILEDKDFINVKLLCDNHDGWTCSYEKKTNRVWTRPTENSDLVMIKVIPHYTFYF